MYSINNIIGISDLCKGVPYNRIKIKVEFQNKEILDFFNNKIFYVLKLINALNNLKIIDLTNK